MRTPTAPLAAGLAIAAALAVAAPRADAAPILTFGQSNTGNPITATNPTSSTTTITGTNVPVTVTQILSGPAAPFSAFFNLSASSIGAAQTLLGQVAQQFAGTFSITSGTGGSGTNYLSGTFTDALFGSGSGLTLTASNGPGTSGETVTFTSSVIPASDLGIPQAISLGFTNVTPAAHTTGSPATLAAFTSSVSGTFSAASVPEPASLAVLGFGLIALGGITRAHKVRAEA